MQPHKIEKERRKYNQWVASESLEDYALRYTPASYRQWSPLLIANTAIGSISFLALEAIGGVLLLKYGFCNAAWAIAFASLIIFLCSAPITYYCARYNIDIDLLTRSAGFGYVGSTVTSLIYACFCFIFFALEAAIMAQAFKLYFELPLYLGYIVCSLVIIPLAFYGVTLINKLHFWTQPIWLILMIAPFYAVLMHEPRALDFMMQYTGELSDSNQFDPYYFGIATGISLALIAQIGEQVDYLRFMPDKQPSNQYKWWFAVIVAGPGWVILGFLKQMGGVLLASLAVLTGLAVVEAKEPVQMYHIAYTYIFDNQQIAVSLVMIFVVISQIKINVTNAYAGSLAWSNFFSRVTHSHPGRVVWMVFNIAIALMLMEMGVFNALEKILGLYSNIAIAWIGAIVADLVINKPLKLSPPMVEFKRAHLYNFNPVGFASMLIASLLSIAAFTGLFGLYAQAYSALLALIISLLLSPLIAWLTKGKYYIARPNEHYSHSDKTEICGVCEQQYAQADFAYCSFHSTPICSLCCTLDSSCHDSCKPKTRSFYQNISTHLLGILFQHKTSESTNQRIAHFLLIWGSMLTLIAITLWLIFSLQTVDKISTQTLVLSFQSLFFALAFFSSIAAWWVVLIHESRELAELELQDQNEILISEIKERNTAEKQATELANEFQQQTRILQANYKELSATHQQLTESELRFKELIQVQSAIFWRVDLTNFRFSFVSKQAELLLGYAHKNWLAVGFWVKHLAPDDKDWVLKYCRDEIQALRNHEFECRMIAANGQTLWFRNVVNLVIKKGKVTELIGFMIDITQNKQDRERIQYLSDLYASLGEINHAIVHIDNEQELFDESCRITVKFRSLSMAWIGVKRESDHCIIPIASAGEHLDYLDGLNISSDATVPEGRGPTGTAYRQQHVVTANQLLSAKNMSPWQTKLQVSHWAASYAIPILRDKQSFAVLNVYSSIENYFSAEVIQLLTELGNDLTFALDAMDRETARCKAEKELELSARVFAQSQEAIVICDPYNQIISVNAAFTQITGYSAEEAIGKNPNMLSSGRQGREFYQAMWQEITQAGYWQGEIWNRRKNGEIFPEWMTISVVKNQQNETLNYIAIFSDISQHKETEAKIEHMAHYDPLTDLPNRTLLKAHVDHELIVAKQHNTQFALLFLDLDHFKNINDSLGHSIGDKLLIDIAQRLKSVIKEEDTVSRLGGDEFNIFLPNIDFKAAAIVAERIINSMSEAIYIENNKLHISASVGISLFPDNGQDYETLYKNADTALYQAKENGRNQYQFFTPEMQVLTMRRMEIENHLRHAILNDEFFLFYQAQVDAKTKKIIGAEALLRWRHPEWGLVSPAEFIPIAEDTGLIITIGDWVLEQAIEQTKQWHEAGYPICIAINLSMAQFNEKVLFQKVKYTLEHAQLEPHFLELELTESIAMKNAEVAIKITQHLADLGVQLSIDDFGTGYSSLSYLQRFALHKLKIDQSFSLNMVENKETDNIVNAIIGLAKSLNLKTIAEGVETQEQLELFVEKGCDEIQGYYFSRPIPAAEFTELLKVGVGEIYTNPNN
ncbi:MAG: EAL domain-containing protein [Methyloprofundus sp.]|nr:EAL domain-containing protein [Methyloprofundus sp.]